MSILNQKTLKKSVSFSGIGLHTGEKVNLKICPSTPNSGIQFKRIDLKSNNVVIPSVYNVSNATLCTTITNDAKVKVSTIEHLMAALYGLGVDNATIEIDNQEVPILDGSAKYFVEGILKAGLELSNQPIKIIKIEKKIFIEDGNKTMSIEPNKISLDIDFEIKYKNQLIGNQRNSVNVYEDDLTEIYSSRTFCVYEDIENLKRINLARGGSLENAIVVKDDKILNEGGLRNNKEFVNHKILDCIGDIYLSGYKIIAKVVCSQGGHKLTNQLLREVFKNKENFTIVEIKEKNIPHSLINRKYLRSIA